jgi:hypothetical protein
MNPLIQLKQKTAMFLAALLLGPFALLPQVQAVVPAPDGGYPGGNTAEGTNALHNLTSGQSNTAVGLNVLYADKTGGRNTGVGVQTLRFNVGGFSNTAVGVNALLRNITSYNTAIGDSALINNTTGSANTATGVQALEANSGGYFNTANGYQALQRNNIGFRNTANGVAALYNNTSGSSNTALGNGAGNNVTTASNVICIGAGVSGANVSDKCFIGSIYGQNQGFGALPVYVNSSHGLGTVSSSRRFKDDIKPMNKASEVLFALKPVTFRYKKEIDAAGRSQFGLVAEEVEQVNPDLVVRDNEGKTYSVRYDQVNAMLLNEFLKEHRKVEQLTKDFESKFAEQQKQIAALTSGLQKVSAQLEVSKPAPQTVLNNQ